MIVVSLDKEIRNADSNTGFNQIRGNHQNHQTRLQTDDRGTMGRSRKRNQQNGKRFKMRYLRARQLNTSQGKRVRV